MQGVLKALAAVALVFGALYAYGDTGSTSRDRCDDQTMAFVMSQTFVKRQLKAPTTAEFPWSSSDGVNVTDLGNCSFAVSAYVDAQNSFGAQIRSRYYMNIRYNSADKNWYATNIVID